MAVTGVGCTMGILAVLVAAHAAPAAAQLHGQHWEVTPETERATVGDTVALRFRVRLDERDLLFDTVPKPLVAPPDWVRVLSVEKLQRQPDRIYVGHARVAFYRPGRQPVPVFQLPFMRSVKGLSRGTLTSDSASVEIRPVLQAGASTLRDIKEPVARPGPNPLELLAAIAAVIAAAWLAWRGRRPPPSAPRAEPTARPAAGAPPDPWATAAARLDELERERWSARDVAHHYEAVTGALRDCLEALGVPAREHTTRELAWMLPPALLEGALRQRYEEVFGDADLVKFAHWRPDPATADAFLAHARDLLEGWRNAGMGEGVWR